LDWHRVDLKNGKPLGVVTLWPWILPPDKSRTNLKSDLPPTPLAALTADGKRIAVRDPADDARVDAWSDDGKRLFGLKPYDRYRVDWLGWSAGGKLLTQGEGKVTAWDAASGKAVFEVEGGYDGPVALAPGRAWLAACRAEVVDLLDAETGRCLGRCKPAVAGGAAAAVAVASDGQGVAIARPAAKEPDRKGGGRSFLADVWNLADGKATSAAFGTGRLELFHWAAPRHVLAVSGIRGDSGVSPELIDARLGLVTCVYQNPLQKTNGLRVMPLFSADPDGRVWVKTDTTNNPWAKGKQKDWALIALPNPANAAEQALLALGLTVFDLASSPIRVEVDLGGRDRSREGATKLAAALEQKGFTIGGGGLALRLSHKVVTEGGGSLGAAGGQREVKLPKVAFTWRLLDASGAEIWQSSDDVMFPGSSSKFFVKSKITHGGVTGMEITTHYDFGGNDVRKVVPEEILDRFVAGVALPARMPLGRQIKSGSAYYPLPAAADLPSW